MATRIATSSHPKDTESFRAMTIVWTGLLNGDTGDVLDALDLPDKTVQVKGTFGVGGTVVIEDDQDNVLNDPQGNALSFTAKGSKLIAENILLNPRVTAGDGTTNITVTVTAK